MATLRQVMRLRHLKEKHGKSMERYAALRDSCAEKEREIMARFKENTGYDINDIADFRKDENGKDCLFFKTNQYINEMATLRQIMTLWRMKEKNGKLIKRYAALRDSYAEKERKIMARFKEDTGYDIDDIAGFRKDENGKDYFFFKTNQ